MAINKSVILYVLILVCHLASVSTSNTFQAISCPGDVLTTECAIMGGGLTVWQGTAFQCNGYNEHTISLRHSQFGRSPKPKGTCSNGVIVAQALGVVNNSYISELNVTASLELNNTTVECLHSHNLTETLVRSIQIIVLSSKKSVL